MNINQFLHYWKVISYFTKSFINYKKDYINNNNTTQEDDYKNGNYYNKNKFYGGNIKGNMIKLYIFII